MKVKKATILYNSTKKDVYTVFLRISDYLKSLGIQVFELKLTATDRDVSLEVPPCDIAVSIGGDGTVLSCASLLKGTGIPLLAVKLGTFGYITETSADEFERVFQGFLDGSNLTENRMMLNATVVRNGNIVFSNEALNEITVSSGEIPKLLRLNLFINDVFAANLRSDGILFSTPTGSTAYNLAAGGPILDADLCSIIINPICPFAMSVRPLVVNDNCRIKVVVSSQNMYPVLIFDGHETFDITVGDEIIISRSKFNTVFVRNKERNRIEILRDKLGWAGGFND